MLMDALEGPGGASWVVSWLGVGPTCEPKCTLAREGNGLPDNLRVCSTLDSGLRGSWAGGDLLNGSCSRIGATVFYGLAGGRTFPDILTRRKKRSAWEECMIFGGRE